MYIRNKNKQVFRFFVKNKDFIFLRLDDSEYVYLKSYSALYLLAKHAYDTFRIMHYIIYNIRCSLIETDQQNYMFSETIYFINLRVILIYKCESFLWGHPVYPLNKLQRKLM